MQTIKRDNKQTLTKWIETLASKARNDSRKNQNKGQHMQQKEFNTIMQKAQDNIKEILKQRNKEYGNFLNIANFTNDFFINNMQNIDITEIKEYNACKTAIFMLGLKLARIEKDYTNPHFDSLSDFLGYLQLLKDLNIKDLKLHENKTASKLHKQLIEYANKELNK